jgi:hypothetical protein
MSAMKAQRSLARVRISPKPQRALEITQHKKMLKMKIGPQSLLKTKGKNKWSSEFAENKQVSLFSR